MVIEAFVQALKNFGSVELLLFMSIGIIVGLVFGIIPGLSGIVAVAIILPFVFAMTPEQALPLMIAAMAVQFMGGSITAILLNMPGTPPSAATLIDGFPMSQKGEAGRALGAAMTSSATGSIITVFVALALIPLILPMIMALRTADMVFLILLGISFIGVLGTGSMLKGLISGGLGLLISFIGYQAITAIPRFTLGSMYLYDGVHILPVILGMFAIPEMIALAREGGAIAKAGAVVQGMEDVWRGARDVAHHWTLCLRSSIIGFIAGLIPGVGASAATFIAYGQAKQTSKHPERFGTGTVEGVIAPESANDAKEGGALLTTLALGVPGSGVYVIFLGAITMLGLIPGPEMMTKHLDLSLTLLLIILVASVIGAAIALPLASHLSKIAFIPARHIVPVVLVMVAVGIFSYQEQIADLMVALVFGAVGLFMRRFGYNRPALVLGLVLGKLFERYLFIALSLSGPLFFLRPISLSLVFIIITLFAYRPIKSLIQRRKVVKR